MAVLACAIVLSGISYVYGKYYASKYNKGVGIASNLYFNSDKLRKSIGHTDMDGIVNDADSVNAINVFTNNGAWATSDKLLLTFDIRNYDNSILYNDMNLNITYTVEFVLLDDPVGASYKIIGPDNKTYDLPSKGTKVIIPDAALKGGSLKSDTYGIQIEQKAGEEYKASRVLVMAYPTGPDYIHREQDEDNEYRLLGIFEGHKTDMELTIDSSGFEVQQDDGYNSTTWKNKVADLSGFIYNFKTAGDVVLNSDVTDKDQVVVTWDSRYLDIDNYDVNYLYGLAEDAKTADDPDAKKYITMSEDGNYKSLVVMALPYSSIDITFYKTEAFDSTLAIQNGEDGKSWFENLVAVSLAN